MTHEEFNEKVAKEGIWAIPSEYFSKEALDFPIYIDMDKTVPLKEALNILTEDFVDSGQICDQTVLDLVSALKKIIQ